MVSIKLFLSVTLTAILSSCVTASARSESLSNVSAVETPIDGIDLYGSDRLTLDMVKNSHGELLQKCIDEFLRGDSEAFETDRQALSRALIEHYGLAFAKLTIIRYFNLHNVPGRQAYATIDVVEPKDVGRRMRFLPRPHGNYGDPSGLLKAWDDYSKIGFELLQSGEISGMREECPAYHCIYGHKHPRLAPFQDVFVSGVAKHKDELVRIFLDESNDHARANAAFLLAYISDGNFLVETLSKRINDESEAVRNNVIRVFSDIAAFHREFPLPVAATISILDYPETTDRNKASMVIFGVVSDKDQLRRYRALIMEKAIPTVLRLLRLEQPNNHDQAYLILRTVSGQGYGEHDYQAWEIWYRSQTNK